MPLISINQGYNYYSYKNVIKNIQGEIIFLNFKKPLPGG